MTASMMSSFWGPVTSTTDWCEKNYTHSSYVAEFYNTISNIPCILLALIGLINALRQRFERRFSVLHVSNMILAFGSMLFHATLQKVLVVGGHFHEKFLLEDEPFSGPVAVCVMSISYLDVSQQNGDETPMVWEMLLYLYVLYSPDWHYRSTMPTFLFLYGATFAVIHSLVRFELGFKLHYAVLCLLCVPRMYKYYIYTEDVAAKRLAQLYVATILLGSLCWLLDRVCCEKVTLWYANPQGHAWWHVLMGFNSYFANTFLMFCRAQQLGWQPRVIRAFGFFPYVKIEKPKQQ